MENIETKETPIEASGASTVGQIEVGQITEKRVMFYLAKRRGWQVLPPALRGDVSREVGPSFEPAPSKSVCRGLNVHLEKHLLPEYVGVNANSPEFPSKATEYWNNWGMEAREEGTELNISTVKKKIRSAFNQDEEVIVDFPLVPEDYISYNMIMQNPKVGKTKTDLENIEMWEFYVVDLAEQEAAEKVNYNLEKEAMLEFALLVADSKINKKKILQILNIMKEPGEVIHPSIPDDVLERMLLKKSKMAPEKNKDNGKLFHPFVQVATDPLLKYKAFISELLNYGILTKEGNTYFNGDEALGGLKETIAKLQEPTYSGEKLKLQSRLEDATKKTI